MSAAQRSDRLSQRINPFGYPGPKWLFNHKFHVLSHKYESFGADLASNPVIIETALQFAIDITAASCNFQGLVWVIQSINQSNFYSANIPGVARLSGATARSVFKCEVVEAVP